MIDHGKKNVLGVTIDAVDYDTAVDRILQRAKDGQPCATSALAVHGVITGALDRAHRFRLNSLDLVVPDGQPVRWALNALHGLDLKDRVYGPKLSLLVCRAAAEQGVPVYFYGSRAEVLESLCRRMRDLCPRLRIAGARPSMFRQLTPEERAEVVEEIRASGARILFAGLGCPRQEVFAFEMREHLSMPILAVGAAFDYYSGLLKEPPGWVQDHGLQWLYRLVQEPRRLAHRYLTTNSQFVMLFLLQRLGLWRPRLENVERPHRELLYG